MKIETYNAAVPVQRERELLASVLALPAQTDEGHDARLGVRNADGDMRLAFTLDSIRDLTTMHALLASHAYSPDLSGTGSAEDFDFVYASRRYVN